MELADAREEMYKLRNRVCSLSRPQYSLFDLRERYGLIVLVHDVVVHCMYTTIPSYRVRVSARSSSWLHSHELESRAMYIYQRTVIM